MKNKTLVSAIVISVVATTILNIGFFSRPASASFWDDLWRKIVPESSETAPAPKTETQPYSPAVDYEGAIINAVERASESVVSIVISKNLPVIEQCAYEPFGNLPPQFRQFFGGGFTQPCQTGTKLQEIGGGSGFVISADGMILTNRHVVSDEKAEYTVLTNDGNKYKARVLARDSVKDLAVIKIDKTGLRPAVLGDSNGLRLGQTAIAIGNALGEFRNTVSLGVVSGLARTITAQGGDVVEKIDDLIQTDAAINPGNSGGPLLNLRGEVIGINVAVAEDAQGIGFAIPINQAKRDIESVKKSGRIIATYLGVRYLPVTAELAEKQKLDVDHGALVRGSDEGPAVVAGSPADKAGVRAEDIILEINGEKIDKDHSLGSLVQKHNVGDRVNLKIRRGKSTLTLKVTLEERPNI